MVDKHESNEEHTEGASAKAHAEAAEKEASVAADDQTDVQEAKSSSSPARSQPSEQGEIKEDEEDTAKDDHEDLLSKHRWCKCVCDPAQFNGQDHYYLHMDTQQSQWEEPDEPYWLWDAATQSLDPKGLQYPAGQAAAAATDEADPEYYGYNPKIHGNYDPNAPYAQYHKRKREQEVLAEKGIDPATAVNAEYAATGTFNRFTGAYQDADHSTDRHSDANKANRQMGAFFDVDAAANSHQGRSLKEERRNQTLSKKQIRELAEKRRAKKEKKRLDFYKS